MTVALSNDDNLFDYFHQHVENARGDAGVTLTDDTALYISQLLVDRARTDTPRPSETTLAELHGRAAHATPSEKARTYRELGDRALYAVGYFEESLDRQIVSRHYYIGMGRAAYLQVDHVFKRWYADAFGAVFQELADQFVGCMRILAAVRGAQAETDPVELMQMYERWERTGSETLAVRLRAAGMLLTDDETTAEA